MRTNINQVCECWGKIFHSKQLIKKNPELRSKLLEVLGDLMDYKNLEEKMGCDIFTIQELMTADHFYFKNGDGNITRFNKKDHLTISFFNYGFELRTANYIILTQLRSYKKTWALHRKDLL